MWNNPFVALTMMAPFSIPGFLYNFYQIVKNKYKTSGDKKAKVLIFDEPLTEWQDLMLGVKGCIARFLTERDIKVDYKHNAKSDDLRAVLANEAYQNVVVVGHGGRSQWCSRDGIVYTEDVDGWMEGLPKKTGYFIQFTCGDADGIPLGYSVVENRNRILGYTKKVNLGDRLESLWSESLGSIGGLVTLTEKSLSNKT